MDPGSRELQPRRAGVPQNNILHDVGVSGATGTQERRAWHRLDSRLAGGDTPREVMTGPKVAQLHLLLRRGGRDEPGHDREVRNRRQQGPEQSGWHR